MAFISANLIFDDTQITINTDHIVTVTPGYDGGCNLMLTPATGPGASYTITVKQDYSVISLQLQSLAA